MTESRATDITQDVYNCALWRAIPKHCQPGLMAYVNHHQRVGDFLRAVISNDLRLAVGHADDTNILCLSVYTRWLHNYAPPDCHGSAERYKQWIRDGVRYPNG